MADIENDALFRDVTVVIPAYNEERGIEATLATLTAELPESEIIVVDDGSTDATAAAVRRFPSVVLLQHRFNRGYGAALKTGMRHASRGLIAWFDADNEHKPEVLKAMIRRIDAERLAAVLGQRSSSVSRFRGMGKFLIRLLAFVLKIRAGHDLNCGLRVFRREVIQPHIHLLPNGYSASMTSTIMLVEKKFPFAFHGISINSRIGQSKVALSDGFETLFLVLRLICLFSPMRIFLRLSVGMIAAGLAYGLWVAFTRGEGFPVLAATVITAGVLIGVLGLTADQISQMRLSELEKDGHPLREQPAKLPSPPASRNAENRLMEVR
ncbi:MAG: glycosyltransferase family 2 protein [Burkholderiales bacterium]|nr:glycosyltransferase family 2 protein [Burkholderiales bacterium]